MEWRRPAGRSVSLPLLTFPCTIKSRSSLLALAHLGGPGERAIKRLWYTLFRVATIEIGWNKFRQPAPLLTNMDISLIWRGRMLWIVVDGTKMWADAQHDCHPAKYRWCSLFNAAKFGRRPLLKHRTETLPRRETH